MKNSEFRVADFAETPNPELQTRSNDERRTVNGVLTLEFRLAPR
jgi:hypothetical protein